MLGTMAPASAGAD